MADQADVEAALAALAGAALYPGGLQAACAVPGVAARIYRGHPVAAALDADLAAGRCNISVAASNAGESATRWGDEIYEVPHTSAAMTADVAGSTVQFAGAAEAGQVAAVIADGVSAAWRTRADDTPASVAAALAGLLARQRTASAAGAVLSVPGAIRLLARVEADQPVLRLTRRQRQNFSLTCWCPDPQTRDAVAAVVDAALSGMDFIGLADGTSGRLLAAGSVSSDRWEDAALFSRVLTYSVDYATSLAQTLPRMAAGVSTQMPAGQTSLT